ncbi:uncharacterized protein FMAN_00275 [Fusarium mangiferae]|uniref:Uncharacterized protein n=1 Tax=Fusarium mangiferae TaxID=192010 RepID=A0A1L7U6S4_FUSMA|nr:uncharacterized protein FMAN_00275 [Fusarium mangiferae]CVL02826.1 uncharacterized protein FMAN_00275 [Fusarium mangiferae]
MATSFAGLSAKQKAHTAEMENQATKAFPSMKDLADALVGGSGWLENPDAADRKRVEKHLERKRTSITKMRMKGTTAMATRQKTPTANLIWTSTPKSDFSESDSDPGVCQNAVVRWLGALHIGIAKYYANTIKIISQTSPQTTRQNSWSQP